MGESASSLAPRVGGSTSTDVDNSTNRPEAMRISAQACDVMKRSAITTRIPPNASITASQETVMFMTKTVLDMIAGGCPTDGATPVCCAESLWAWWGTSLFDVRGLCQVNHHQQPGSTHLR
jgi:hypothetical protein